jgi:hypothetical protein
LGEREERRGAADPHAHAPVPVRLSDRNSLRLQGGHVDSLSRPDPIQGLAPLRKAIGPGVDIDRLRNAPGQAPRLLQGLRAGLPVEAELFRYSSICDSSCKSSRRA